jgi:hypothetical protein
VPPVISCSTYTEMRELGWLLAADGHPHDICPWCDLSVPRAGSTSLHNYLALHPDIAMSADKEVRFFTDPDHLPWVGRYQELIPSSHQL